MNNFHEHDLNTKQLNEIRRISRYPIVKYFYAYGLYVYFYNIPSLNGGGNVIVANMDFIPFIMAGDSPISTIAAGIEGMKSLFRFIELEKEKGNNIEPQMFVGFTNERMAHTAERMGFSRVTRAGRKPIFNRSKTRSHSVFLLGNPAKVKEKIEEYESQFGVSESGESLLVRRARARNPDLWSKFDETGNFSETMSSLIEVHNLLALRREEKLIKENRISLGAFVTLGLIALTRLTLTKQIDLTVALAIAAKILPGAAYMINRFQRK
jgi:hypothetical protein